jgi:hypothetical protein
MSANQFVLTHHDIEVEYTVGITPGIPALTYTDGGLSVSFTDEQIATDQTALGTLVSVPLRQTVDTGGERFGFFLPQLEVPDGQSADFQTAGVYETFTGPDSIPHLPTSWRGIDMHGTARTVIVAL